MAKDHQVRDGESGSASPRRRFLGGIRVGLGLAVAVFVLGLTFGALARSQGWGLVAPLVCSAVVFSSSAQFALATVLGGGGTVLSATVASGLINARFLTMGLAAAPSLRGGRWRRAVEGQAVVDGSWVAANLGGGRFDRERLFGATVVQYPAWVAGTALGLFLAPSAHQFEAFGLDLVFPAYFLVMLIDELRSSAQARYAAAISAVLAAGLVFVVSAGVALIGATAAALVGLTPFPRRAR